MRLYRRWRRARMAREAFPEAWAALLREHAPFYRGLDPAVLERFHHLLRVFESEKHFFGAGGLTIEDVHRVVISAAATRLVLFGDIAAYDRLTEIVVYPYDYKHGDNDDVMVLGEAHHFGTVVLSWPAVVRGLANPCDGQDTALHEFAHVLDREAGQFNGTPRLRATEDYRVWGRVLTDHFHRLREGHEPERSVLRAYGATNEAEFFAVATESFFERPARMKHLTPDLYEELSRFYGFDPATSPLCSEG